MRVLVAMLLLLTACATDGGRPAQASPSSAEPPRSRIQVHLHTGQAAPRSFTPPHRVPVEVTLAQFNAAMARLVAELDLPSPPRRPLALLSCGQPGQQDERTALTHSYHRWCEHRGTPGDCLSLLDKGLHLGPEARRTLALSISLHSVWEGAVGVWADMADPVALQSLVMSAMAGYLVMLAFPNPVTQAAAVSFGCFMVAYLGLDTVWSLLEGFRQLELETQRARTFAEVREAGERFGRVMGAQVGRLLVMLATAALGSTTNLMMKGPGLPGYTQAAVTARTQVRLNLTEVGQVRQVLVGQASFTLSLAPGALAMASQGTSGGGNTSAPSQTAHANAPSKYRLKEKDIESWRKPRFTEDGKILPHKGTRNPPNPITNLGRNRAGQTVTNGKVTVRFDENGFAKFETKFEAILDDVHIGSGRPELHMKSANRRLFDALKSDPGLAEELGLSQTSIEQLLTLDRAPRGYVWHHHQDVCRMQLVQEEAHILSRPHTGGMAIWGGGY